MRRPVPPLAAAGFTFTLALLAGPAIAQSTPSSAMTPTSSPSSSVAQDNTAVNKADRSHQQVLPTDQPNDKADIKLAAAVRHAVVKDKKLSSAAHNVKMVTAQGVVTLRGIVKNDDEKMRVENDVKGVNGVTSVNNELTTKH